jgi:hypothetical protein
MLVLASVSWQAAAEQPTAASSPLLQSSGGDGTTKDSAIVISAADEVAGVDAEYAWIKDNLPGAKIKSQGLVMGPRAYDRFEVALPSGETRAVYFDISSFFGKR